MLPRSVTSNTDYIMGLQHFIAQHFEVGKSLCRLSAQCVLWGFFYRVPVSSNPSKCDKGRMCLKPDFVCIRSVCSVNTVTCVWSEIITCINGKTMGHQQLKKREVNQLV